MLKSALKAAAVSAAALAGVSAQAALVMTSPACTASVFTPSYTACGGSFAGNNMNQQADVLAFISSEWGQTATFGGSSDDAMNGPFTSNPNTTTGTLTFDTAMDGPFVLALKAADQFSLFYFDGSGPANLSSAAVDLLSGPLIASGEARSGEQSSSKN